MQSIKMIISNIIQYIKIDIWRLRTRDLPRIKAFFVKQIRILSLTVQGFTEDMCMLRASALTFFSLLAIVPVAAMAFGVAKGFGFEKNLEKTLLTNFSAQEEVVLQIINFANSLLENTRGGVIAGIGLIVLFWSIIRVLGHIELALNDIWEIKKSRSLARRFSDYLSIMLISPILFIMSGSAMVLIETKITMIMEKIALLGMISPLIFFVLKMLPYCLIWILFTFIYIIMPNTRVNFRSGFIAGVISGTIYQLAQWAYIYFQIGIAKYNAIYGSFAALPLFLIWLQLSWIIVLIGAEISFAHQNVDTFEFEPDSRHINPSFERLLALQILHLMVKAFSKGDTPFSASRLSDVLDIPIRLCNRILKLLVDSKLITNTNNDEKKEAVYQPAQDTNLLTVKYALNCLEQNGVNRIPIAETDEQKEIEKILKTFKEEIERSPANKLLKEI